MVIVFVIWSVCAVIFFLIPALMLWVIGMMVVYTRIEARHRKQRAAE